MAWRLHKQISDAAKSSSGAPSVSIPTEAVGKEGGDVHSNKYGLIDVFRLPSRTEAISAKPAHQAHPLLEGGDALFRMSQQFSINWLGVCRFRWKAVPAK